MSKADTPRSQIERAQRFAAAMTNDTERKRFEAMAFELRRELASVEIRDYLSDGDADSRVRN